MPSPGPAGMPWRVVATMPADPVTHPIRVNADELVGAAVASGRITPRSRDGWLQQIKAGGRHGADSIMAMLELPDDEAVWQAMYPSAPAPRPPAEPDWTAMADIRNAWLTSVQAAGPPAHHEQINHEPLTVREHIMRIVITLARHTLMCMVMLVTRVTHRPRRITHTCR